MHNFSVRTLSPAFDRNNISVVFATDGNYVPFLSVALASLVRHASDKNNYDIILLVSDISLNDRQKLASVCKKSNFSLRFYDTESTPISIKHPLSSYYTSAIFYRLLLPFIMTGYKKTVYLDCDLVLKTDVAELFSYEIEDRLLGAVRDVGMIVYRYNTSDLQYIPADYFEKKLSSVSPDDYINSGVLLLNLDLFRERFTWEELLRSADKKGFLYPDQDALNVVCSGSVLFLPMAWNTFPYNSGTRSEDFLCRYLPAPFLGEYARARSAPKIIHYNMLEKPWLHPCFLDHDLMLDFWRYALLSPYFDRLLYYPPTPFYCSKHKPKIPYFERRAVLQALCGSSSDLRKTSSDVYFCSGAYLLQSLSSLPVKMETLDVGASTFTVHASFSLGTDDIDGLERVLYADEAENKYPCLLRPKGAPYLFGDRPVGKEYILTCTLPLPSAPERFRLFFVYGGKHIRMRRFLFSVHFPVDKIFEKQYFFKNGYIFRYDGAFCCAPCTRREHLKAELAFSLSLLRSSDRRDRYAGLLRLPLLAVKRFMKKPIWLIGCNRLAEDNGFALFSYLSSKKDVRAIFALNEKHSPVADKARAVGRTVWKYGRLYQLLFVLSSLSASSIADLRLLQPFAKADGWRDVAAGHPFVFLQHGVTTQDQSREHNRFVYNPALFCTAALPEYRAVEEGNYFLEGKVALTGFPRFDRLYRDEKKKITVMPTWRKYLHGDFGKNTLFFRFYDDLLHNPRLQAALRKYGYILAFKPHPTVALTTDLSLFRHGEEDDCFAFDGGSYVAAFAESNLLVTDYSSAVFDFLYLEKPVVYAQFDREEFFSGKHVYEKGFIDYEKNGFGEVETTLDGTVDRIIEYMQNGCKLKPLFRERLRSFFAFRDNGNAERVYAAMKKL